MAIRWHDHIVQIIADHSCELPAIQRDIPTHGQNAASAGCYCASDRLPSGEGRRDAVAANRDWLRGVTTVRSRSRVSDCQPHHTSGLVLRLHASLPIDHQCDMDCLSRHNELVVIVERRPVDTLPVDEPVRQQRVLR